ncbi:hypothetical protein VOLCADRAFT_80915 [Volvox carteri f. nagariensis]|uniref:Uncharacterized protein n=1 Tax=Volvox carteri f. nagariensis TaxID=3068 RepID=D8TUG9_VOLCA|nr:uncharacterized protein VOLCADRAFT_80915 [Volvox carteri f. nagariensis]EFJ48705.1 hypothetical protein VOLCADRAFT_80915 [Volvox carteri f. nagariensis]|eukprot:XP_002950037.1 hypothetical protein VOLCADRAFT_80915 [Volvox carteri f. nagariensis]
MQAARAISAGPSGRSLAATSARRVSSRRGLRCVAMLGADPTFDTISAVSQLITTSAICVGALMLLNRPEQLPEQDRLDSRKSQPCPVCGGTGFEACLCTRWSDGDVGCNSCSKTGYMRCRGCGGGGTAVPLMVRVKK